MGGDNWGGEEEGNLSGKGSSEDPRNPHGTNLCPPPLLGPPYAGTALVGGGQNLPVLGTDLGGPPHGKDRPEDPQNPHTGTA